MCNRLDRWLAPLLGVAILFGAVFDARNSQANSQANEQERELYRWVDRGGVVRYTPDLSRIPDTRRETVIRVISGTSPLGLPLKTPAKTPAAPSMAPLGPALAGADPFNAPSEARRVEQVSTDPAFEGTTWPELDARIAELEILIQADEEIIKEMISAPQSPGSDDLTHSPVLRQIAARLPILQGELNELRRWREQPRDR
jgi:hypothetical protein